MYNQQELFEDIQSYINKTPFITVNGKTGIIIREYHWSIKSQINLITEALKGKVDKDIFILGEDMSKFKYICIEPTIKNLSNYPEIKDIVEETLKEENLRVAKQIDRLLLLHK